MIRLLVFVALLAIVVGTAIFLNPQSRSVAGKLALGSAPVPEPSIDAACDRASHLAKTAWSSSVPMDRYQAAADGLDYVAACGDADQRIFGEAMLLAVKTEAEYRMQVGNARWDASRAVERLDACIAHFEKTSPQAEACRKNRAGVLTYFPGPPAPKS
jgi:hypothetical protein